MTKLELLKKQAILLPHLPGVYSYKDQTGTILYIGKAKNLYKRVNSYFNKTPDLKTSLLLSQIDTIDYTVTPTEIDALTLEDQLINTHQPHYNILLKEDSSYRYICISHHTPPKIITSRKPIKKYYCLGPFPFATHQIVNIARDILGLTKNQYLTTNNWQLYLEAASFRGKKMDTNTEQAELYHNFITKLVQTIKNGDHSLITEYQQRMEFHAQRLEFEQALQYRNKITLLQKMTQRTSQINPAAQSSEHLIISLKATKELFIFLFNIQHGLLHLIQEFKFKLYDPFQQLESFIKQYYSQQPPPRQIIIHLINQSAQLFDPMIMRYLSNKWQKSTKITIVKHHKLLPIALKNIEIKINHKINLASQLKQLLRLSFTPDTIDFIDISNLSDNIIIGGVVRFVSGEPVKNLWRHYTIKTVPGQNDYASIFETISRRYRTISLPDVIVVDGGIGQLNVVQNYLSNNPNVSVFSLAKTHETLIYPNHHTYQLSLHDPAEKFLIYGRDTVHNFVVQHCRKIFKKHYKASWLDLIPGIGPNTKLKLLAHFKSSSKIKQASSEELILVIGKAKTRLLIEYLTKQL